MKAVKVGDVVQVSVNAIMSGQTQEECEEGYGIVVGIRGNHIKVILWYDGLIEEQHEHDLAVIYESR